MSFATLILAEHFEGKLNPNFGNILTTAHQLKDKQVDVLIHGADCTSQIDQIKKYNGVNSILVVKDATLHNSYGDSVARVVKHVV